MPTSFSASAAISGVAASILALGGAFTAGPAVAASVSPLSSSSAFMPPVTSAAPARASTHPTLRRGSSGAAVRTLQNRLQSLGYWTGGPADGQFGALTEQAVFALQKTAGLTRSGVAGPQTWAALAKGVRPTARSKKGHVIEVDLKHQVLKLVNNGKVTSILNTSTGSGRRYVSQGATHVARTPAGHFHISRQVNGWRHAPLGLLWRPKYFNGGIAIHGYSSVPAYPASHGCVRVSMAAANWLWNTGKDPLGTAVWVY
jgi:lipoprotein-anchoring transpeptidase ErfK/SrfK